MEEVVIYTRVSTDEQADKGYSLRDQTARLKNYCALYDLTVVGHFQDDFSAKTFERPEFIKLLNFIKDRKAVRKILFLKWDRFSRNLNDAMNMLVKLRKMNVEANAIEQIIDFSIPEQKMMLAIYLTAPEIENTRRAMNTTQGMRRAKKEGRWVSTPPLGYSFSRDEKNKPIIIQNAKAPLIRETFELYATGLYHIEEVRKIMNKKGLNCGRNNMWLILRNPIYSGMILIKAYMKEPEEIIKGLHEPIVSEELFIKAQQMHLQRGKIKSKPKKVNETFPLRGYLICPRCGRNLSGSHSVGKVGGRYAYYHCMLGCKERQKAEVLNQQITNLMKELQLKPEIKDLFLLLFEKQLALQSQNSVTDRKLLQQKLNQAKSTLEKIDEKYLHDDIDKVSYNRLILKQNQIIEELQIELSNTSTGKFPAKKDFEKGLHTLSSLGTLYENATVEQKRFLLSSIFTEKLIFEENSFRTPEPNELIGLLFNAGAGFQRCKRKKTGQKTDLSLRVARRGIEPLFHP